MDSAIGRRDMDAAASAASADAGNDWTLSGPTCGHFAFHLRKPGT